MGNKGKSVKGLFGEYTHYDENGKEVGKSVPGLFGNYTNFDAKGNKIGKSVKGVFGEYYNFDEKGNKTSTSVPGFFGDKYTKGKDKKGTMSFEGPLGGYSHEEGGCYIATCVYGSYDCPEVWMLRRYRDYYLKKYKLGRLFIKFYYKISPKLVKKFGENKLFKELFKRILDKKLLKLKENGYSSKPYIDK